MAMKSLFAVLVGGVLFLSTCSPAQEKAPKPESPPESTQLAPFRPNPQPVEKQAVATLAIGADAPDFNLPGVDGKYYRLADFSYASVLVVVFTCNHCPTAQAYEDRIKEIAAEYQDRKVALVAISPNSPLGLLYEECGYSDLGDTFEDMRSRARHHQFNFPYLYDGDLQQVSIQYGPVSTPHAFVFDENRKLQYVGRIDGEQKPGEGQGEDLRGAIEAVLDGKSPANPVTKAFGCSIKWAWKNQMKEKVDREWQEAPISLEDIDAAGLKGLLKNDSEKLRLINVWATWCGPCIIEFPDLVVIHRMYKKRDFEVVTVSGDSPESKAAVIKFLEMNDAAMKNYLFAEEDSYALVEAMDPNWSGAIPFTLLVEPGGKVIYRQEGIIDPFELKRLIVEHPMIGRYYR